MMKPELDIDMNKITHGEEKVALVLGIKHLSLQCSGCSNDLSSCLCHEICIYQDSNACYERPQILR